MAEKTETETEPRAPNPLNRRTVRVKPQTYQPKKTELEEEFRIKATPEDVIRAAFQQARVVKDPDA